MVIYPNSHFTFSSTLPNRLAKRDTEAMSSFSPVE